MEGVVREALALCSCWRGERIGEYVGGRVGRASSRFVRDASWYSK